MSTAASTAPRRAAGEAEARLCDFVAAIRWEDLHADVQERTRFCLVDTVGAAIAGLATPAAAIAARLAPRVWGGDESTVLLDGARASAAGANQPSSAPFSKSRFACAASGSAIKAI